MKSLRIEDALNKINNLTQENFEKIANWPANYWQYLGSNSKSDGNDVFWMRFTNGYYEMITSSTYGDDDQFYLVEETTLDLASLKKYAKSVIESADCLSNDQLDPQVKTDFAEIIHNIAHGFPGLYKENTTTLTNPDLREEAINREVPMGEELINKIFAEIASNYEIPFN